MDVDKAREALDFFGEVVVYSLKDSVLRSFDNVKGDRYGSGSPESGLGKAVSAFPEETQEVIRDCIINAIATGVHNFLSSLSNLRNEEIMYLMVNGVDIVRASEGINTEYMFPTGWEARFSEYPTDEEVLKKYILRYNLEIPELFKD